MGLGPLQDVDRTGTAQADDMGEANLRALDLTSASLVS